MATILVADDSMFQRFKLGKLLREDGHTVVEAKDGRECLQIIRSMPIDGVFLDLNMPEMDGFEVLRNMEKEYPDIPVIVVTADIQEDTGSIVEELGASEILIKPFDDEKLLHALNEHFINNH